MKNNLFLVCILSLIVNLNLPTQTAAAADRFERWVSADTGSSETVTPGESKRLALVIGNSDYHAQPLRNPANDARAMDRILSDHGFEVTRLAGKHCRADELGDFWRGVTVATHRSGT